MAQGFAKDGIQGTLGANAALDEDFVDPVSIRVAKLHLKPEISPAPEHHPMGWAVPTPWNAFRISRPLSV